MIIVTGAYGFIGSQFVRYLNSIGVTNIIVSDYLTNGKQFKNLDGCDYEAFIEPERIIKLIAARVVDYVFHFGAVSDTTCWDGELVMKRNYHFTTDLILNCDQYGVPISYSSSASVYGNGDGPLNLYAYSKHLVDRYVDGIKDDQQIQGFRYFNVYGWEDEEWHKGNQASPFYKFKQQALETGRIEIFNGSEYFKRDFIEVSEVCRIQWMMSKREVSGIFDLGTGKQLSFLDVAEQVQERFGGEIVTIPFPSYLKGHYQTNTRADMSYIDQLP